MSISRKPTAGSFKSAAGSFKPAAGAFLVAAAALALALASPGCATSRDSSPAESGYWPATIPALRDAIEIERARLKEIVSQPAEGSARLSASPDDLIDIAERLAHLQASLEALEAEAQGESEGTAP